MTKIRNKYELVAYLILVVLINAWAIGSANRLLFVVGLTSVVILMIIGEPYYERSLRHFENRLWQKNTHKLSLETLRDPDNITKIMMRRRQYKKGAVSSYDNILKWLEDQKSRNVKKSDLTNHIQLAKNSLDVIE